ncbi:MAG TPA: FHA domain-containing protein [Verrucomicrobiales bacterium]|jgi:pSer/pThr/pTyr-binding forkhead associated (FHA) protein|nr:FHA domain-containing protein [Verrucomicrobiales bacterium]
MARLRTASGHVLNLPDRRISVGESAANDVPIAAGHNLAAVHFRLQPWESGYFLEDAGSGLGTLVNEKPVSWAPLKHGDIITAGDLHLIYDSEDGTPISPLPAESVIPVQTEGTTEPDKEAVEDPPTEAPPSWLPPEALQPPVPPWDQTPAPVSIPSRRRRTALVPLLVLLLAAAAVWYFNH